MGVMKLVELKDFEWTDDYSFHRELTCVNHPTAKYLTKNPWARGLHLVKLPDGMYTECPCPFSDLRVVVRDEEVKNGR